MFHHRLGAMMPRPDRDPFLIHKRPQVVRVDIGKDKRQDGGFFTGGPDQAKSRTDKSAGEAYSKSPFSCSMIAWNPSEFT